jgi:hypothetical protein
MVNHYPLTPLMESTMAKGGGFDAKDTGNIAGGPSSKNLGVPAAPARSTVNDGAVRSNVARNPSGGDK